MALNDFNRNYGASLNSREFFFGNVGFLTFAGALPAGVEFGVTAIPFADTDEYQTAASAAAYNQFKVAELIGQRCVITATSDIIKDNTPFMLPVVDGERIISSEKIGTAGAISGITAITFIIERAYVLVAEGPKPGAGRPADYAVTPTKDMLDTMATPGFFRKADGADAEAIVEAAMTVFQWTQPILA